MKCKNVSKFIKIILLSLHKYFFTKVNKMIKNNTISELEQEEPIKKGKLYIVSTPIGNDEDITLRALRVLKSSDFVVCEEGKIGARMLHKLNLHMKMELLNEQNEEEKTIELLKLLEEGNTLSLVSDAGTPVLADPGINLVRACIKRDIKMTVIPGASSIMAAVVRSGFRIDQFLFAGFLNRDNKVRLLELKRLKDEHRTVVLFETPYRLMPLLTACMEVMPDRNAYLGCNLTMPFESHHYGNFSELFEKFSEMKFKGEFVLCFEGSTKLSGAERIQEDEVFDLQSEGSIPDNSDDYDRRPRRTNRDSWSDRPPRRENRDDSRRDNFGPRRDRGEGFGGGDRNRDNKFGPRRERSEGFGGGDRNRDNKFGPRRERGEGFGGGDRNRDNKFGPRRERGEGFGGGDRNRDNKFGPRRERSEGFGGGDRKRDNKFGPRRERNEGFGGDDRSRGDKFGPRRERGERFGGGDRSRGDKFGPRRERSDESGGGEKRTFERKPRRDDGNKFEKRSSNSRFKGGKSSTGGRSSEKKGFRKKR
jgi:16S rRNA (cytidine1402-2'-O)-methyltransferase